MGRHESPPSSATEPVEDTYTRTHAGLIRLAGLLTGDIERGADLVADAFAGYLKASRRAEIANVDAYLRQAVVNGAIGGGRRREVRERHGYRAASPRATEDRTGQVDTQLLVWNALQELPARQRAVLVLRYYEDLPVADVAAQLDIAVGTVKSITSRALARLEQAIPQGDET